MKRVAIIEDDPGLRMVLRGLLEEAGYTVVAEGQSGTEAVRVCEQVRPDLIIMDVGLPGIDGIEAAEAISRRRPTPVILLTARADAETIRRATEAGVMAYLVKPVRFEDLAPAIELASKRFTEFEVLRHENLDLKETLEARRVIEKAKGLLMEKDGLTEAGAFARIRKISMDKRKTMKEVAEVIILALEES